MSYDRLNAVSLGVGAASTMQGSAAVAIGYRAGAQSQPPSSIVINASGQALSGVSTNALYIAPIRNASGSSFIMYDTLTKEAVHGTTFNGTLTVDTLSASSMMGSTMSASTMNIAALNISSLNNSTLTSFIGGGGTGYTGPTGADGLTGPQGPAGAESGLTGPTGPEGAVGADGATGPEGPIGADGLTGPEGPVGADGATGPEGPIGADGATGADGPVGADGATGPEGPVGADGATGADGPVGADGATGADGPVGADGPTGADGPIGPEGPVGSIGPEGPTGPEGPIGADGATGPEGAVGATGYTGPTGPQGIQGVQGSQVSNGNVATVDAIYGNDSTASVGGSPYLTINAAIAAITTGQTVRVLPGTYTLSAGITLPAGSSIRGLNTQTCIVQMTGVTTNTTLVTMGENTRMEDLTLRLTSSDHYLLKGVVFGGTTSRTAKIRTCVITVDNSTAIVGGASTVTGIEFNGTGSLGPASFSFNSIKGITVNVYSNGGGNKRGLLVSTSNIVTVRDTNVYVAAPTNTASTGSYVGVETADSADLGSIQLRSASIGTVTPTSGQAYTASDILQTNPTTITNPTYLASPGVQIGPGTDLVSKTAGGKGFTTYVYPTIIYYGLRGDIKNITGSGGYLWPGTQVITGGSYPDNTSPAAYFRVQQPALLSGLSVGLNTAPGAGHTLTILVQHTPIATGTITNTAFTVTLFGTSTFESYYNSSVRLATGDRVHVYISYDGNNQNAAHDITIQVDMF